MSNTIDKKIVEMKFDNASFERNIKTSMTSIDNLKQKLKFDKANAGLDNINKSVKNVNMAPLGSAVEGVGVKFSAMQVIAATALSNVTNSVINAGKKMVKEFTIEPITTGLSEYETQLNAVQTILANTQSENTTLGQVNGALDKLNTYSDKTIYNFTEMTRNIGTFTAAGVKLDDSVTAIKGIANLAAISGSTSQQASTAMYQLSQALAAGRVSLQDWNSVVNAGMGGKVFQDALKRTAKVMGVAVDESESFRESIGGGDSWLSAEILTATLAQFTGDLSDAQLKSQGFNAEQVKMIQEQAKNANEAATKVKTYTQLVDTMKESVQSGWGITFRTILGDFEEAKEFYTGISEKFGGLIGEMNDSRNELLIGGLSSGWKQYINEGIIDEEAYIGRIKKLAYERKLITKDDMENISSYSDLQDHNLVTSKLLGDGLALLTKDYSKLTEEEKTSMGITQEQIDKQTSMNNAYKIGARDLDEFIRKMNKKSGRDNLIDSLYNSFDALGSVLKPIKEAFGEVFDAMTPDDLYNMTVKLREFTESLKLSDETASKLKSIFKGLFTILKGLGEAFGFVAGLVGKLLDKLKPLGALLFDNAAKMGDYISEFDGFEIPANKFGDAIKMIIDRVKEVKEKIKEFFSSFSFDFKFDGITYLKDGIDSVGKSLEVTKQGALGFKDTILAIFDNIKNGFDSSFMIDGFKKVAGLIAELVGALADGLGDMFSNSAGLLENIDFGKIFDATILGGLGVLILKIKKMIKSLKGVDILKSISGMFDGVTGVLDGVTDSLKAVQQQLKAKILQSIAFAVLTLAGAILILSMVDIDKLLPTLAAVVTMVGTLALVIKMYSGLDMAGMKTMKVNNALIGMSVAILILSSALLKLAKLNWNEIGVGVGGIGAVVAILCATLYILSKNEKKINAGLVKLAAICIAIKVLSGILIEIGSMNGKSVIAGIAGLASSMFILVAGINSFKKTKGGSLQMIFAATALTILMVPIKQLGSMNLESLAKGVGAVAASMIILCGGLKLFGKIHGGAVNMMVAALALTMLVAPITLLGNLSLDSIGKSLLAMSGSLVALAFSMSIFGKVKKGMIGMLLAVFALNKLIVPLTAISLLPTESLIKGIVGISAAIAELTLAMYIMGKCKSGTGSLTAAAIALMLLTVPMSVFGKMNMDAIGRGLFAVGGAIAILAIGLNLMKGTMNGCASMIMAAVAINMLVVPLKILGTMPLSAVVTSLVAIGGALAIFTIAAYALGPVTPILLAVNAAIALFGVAILSIGGGLLLAAMGLSGIAVAIGALAAAITASGSVVILGLTNLLISVINLIPALAKAIAEGIVAIIVTLAENSLVLFDSLGKLLIKGLDCLVDAIPAMAKVFLDFILESLKMLNEYAGPILDELMQFLVTLLQKVAERMPELVEAGVDIFVSILEGIASGFKNIDSTVLIDSLKGVGFITAILAIATSWVVLGVTATVGCLAAAAAVTAITALITALGAIAAIPGLSWFVDKGLGLLQIMAEGLGIAIGAFVNGVLIGATAGLPIVGKNLSTFMANLQGFIDGANSIKEGAVDGVAKLVTIIMSLSAANVLEGITSFITGKSSIDAFSTEIVKFGEAIVEYSKIVSGNVDESAITATANAGETLAKMAKTIPNSGGILGKFFGENTMADFAAGLEPFANAIVSYSKIVSGNVDASAIQASATAGKALTELADTIPNSGGLLGKFFGNNDMGDFAAGLEPFANAVVSYSKIVSGNVDATAIQASATAGKSLTELADTIPNSGGLLGKFFGDNDMGDFAEGIIAFGEAVSGYSEKVVGIDAGAIESSALAGGSLAELYTKLKDGGDSFLGKIFGKSFDGETFKSQIIPFGETVKAYSDAVIGISPESVENSAYAADIILALSEKLNDFDGIDEFFNNTYSSVSNNLVSFGKTMLEYSRIVSGVNVTAIECSYFAANALVALAEKLPTGNAITNFFGVSYTVIGDKLLSFANVMKEYSYAISGINLEMVNSSAIAANALVSLSERLPSTTGLMTFFGGDMTKFGNDLIGFGSRLKEYSDIIGGINLSILQNTTLATASLIKLSNDLESTGKWFFQDGKLESFGKDLSKFGVLVSDYSSSISDVSAKKMNDISYELRTLTAVAKGMEPVNSDAMGKFGDNLARLGRSGINEFIKAFNDATNRVRSAGADMINDLIGGIESKTSTLYALINQVITNCNNSLEDKSEVFNNTGGRLIYALSRGMYDNLEYVRSSSRTATSQAAKAVDETNNSMYESGKKMVSKVANGISNCKNDIVNAFNYSITQLVTKIKGNYNAMYYSGKYLVQGFSNGIDQNRYLAVNSAGTMASLAATKARKVLNVKSPSRVLKEIGGYFSEGFAIGISDKSNLSEKSSETMANNAKNALQNAISKIPSLLNDIDDQPTIRPILDLSNIQNGIDYMNNNISGEYKASINGSNDLANSAARGINRYKMSSFNDTKQPTNNVAQTISNTFNITGDNPNEIALEVSRIIQKQLNRKETVWA